VDLSTAISQKRCKIGGKLLLITNRKSNMSFRLVPNSMTLNDIERRNSPNGTVILSNSVAFKSLDCRIKELTSEGVGLIVNRSPFLRYSVR